MRLDPPPKPTVRVHELAKELGWPPSRLVDELRSRGEWVTSPMNTIEAPVVRAIRRDFAAVAPAADPEETLEPTIYGESADLGDVDTGNRGETFAEALQRVKAQPPRHKAMTASSKSSRWRTPVLQALLDEVIAQRPDHLASPSGGHYGWELKKAEKRHVHWTAARLDGLAGEDSVIIEWIRLSGGLRPGLAAELSSADISPAEAGLRLGYGGRIDSRMDPLYARVRDRRITRSEAIAAVRLWRQNSSATG